MATDSLPELDKIVPEAHDFLPLLGTDHVELIVGNAKQSAYYYMAAWGFQPLAFILFMTMPPQAPSKHRHR